jgi:hypothetical protein
VNHHLYRHLQRCIELRIAAAASTSTILSVSSITATAPHSYRNRCFLLQPLATAAVHNYDSSYLPLSSAAAFYRYREISTTILHRYFLPPPFYTDAAFYRCFLPPPFSIAAAFYRRRFLPMPLSSDAAVYCHRFLPPLLTTATRDRSRHGYHDRNHHNRRDRNRYNRYFNHRRNCFNRPSCDNCLS